MDHIQRKKAEIAKNIAKSYNQPSDNSLEKGGPGSGRHNFGDYVVHRNPKTNKEIRGRVHSQDKDGKYHNIRTTTGDLEYVESKHTRSALDSEKDRIHKKMSSSRYADGKTYDSDFEKAEGDRGGNVIGHDASGKPIYASSQQQANLKNNKEKSAQEKQKRAESGERSHEDMHSQLSYLEKKELKEKHTPGSQEHKDATKEKFHQKFGIKKS